MVAKDRVVDCEVLGLPFAISILLTFWSRAMLGPKKTQKLSEEARYV